MTPFLLILSSPSGGGKTTIARMLLRDRPDLGYSVSATTRPIRRGEREGVDYYFISEQAFQGGIERGEFVEWALYGGHLYGTPEKEIDRVLRGQQHVVLDIEVQGARQIQQRRQDVVSIFILPPSAEVLLQRLQKREREDDAQIHQRLLRAVEELREATAYDYVVINDELDQAVSDISAIIDAESRTVERFPELRKRIAELQKGLGRAAMALARK